MEASARGYLIDGRRRPCLPASYQRCAPGRPGDPTQVTDLIQQSADNPAADRRGFQRIRAMQEGNGEPVRDSSVIELRRTTAVTRASMPSSPADRPAAVSERIRTEFDGGAQDASSRRCSRTGWTRCRPSRCWASVAYVLFIIVVNGSTSPWAGRRDINQLSHDFGGALKAQTDAANVLSEQAWVRDGQAQLAEDADRPADAHHRRTQRAVVRRPLPRSDRRRDIRARRRRPAAARVHARFRRRRGRRPGDRGTRGPRRAGHAGRQAQPRHQPQGRLLQGRHGPGRDSAGRADRGADQQRRRRQRRHRAGLHAPGHRARHRAAEAGVGRDRRLRGCGAVPQAPAGFGRGNPAAQRGTAGAAGRAAHRQRGAGRAVARAHRVAAAPGAPAGRARGHQHAAVRAGERARSQERGAQRRAGHAAGTRRRTAAREPLQVRVPGQHVARAAHAAQLVADPGQAAQREQGRQPQRRAAEVRADDLRRGQRPAEPDQRHPRPLQGGGRPPGAAAAVRLGASPGRRRCSARSRRWPARRSWRSRCWSSRTRPRRWSPTTCASSRS